MKKVHLLSADFETTSNQDNPEVYSWGMMNEKNEFKYGISIETFLDEIKKIDKDCIMYFHNGAKFDAHFIVPKLTENGFNYKLLPYPLNPKNHKTFIEKSEYRKGIEEDDEYNKYLEPMEFSLLVDGNHKIMEIKIGLEDKKNEHNRVLIIRDSNLLFTGSIKSYGETLNKALSSTLYSKMGISSNYEKESVYASLNEFENDGNELEYLKQDTFILIEYLKFIDKTFSRKNWKITAASTAYSTWKYNFFGKKLLDNQLASGNVEMKAKDKGMKTYKFKNGKKYYSSKKIKDKLITKVLPTKELPKDLFNWYGGGLTGANPIYRGVVMDGISSVDYNSHYPAQMVIERMPFGLISNGRVKGNDFEYFKITTTSDCINKQGVPFVQVPNNSMRMPYANIIPKNFIIYLTTISYNNFKKYYKGTWKEEVCYSQKTIDAGFLYKEYIDFYYEKKANPITPSEKEIAKLMLNALYGKFGTKNERMSRIWNDNSKSWEREISTEDLKYYLPLAIAITEYARMKIVSDVGFNFKYVLGYDTDSIYFREKFIDKFDFQLDDKLIGYLKVEHQHMTGFFRRSKQYVFKLKDENQEYKIAFAGVNFNKDITKINFKNFIAGCYVDNQLRPIKLPSGVHLEEYEKEVKPIWDESYIKSDEGMNLWYQDEDSFMKNYENQKRLLEEIE